MSLKYFSRHRFNDSTDPAGEDYGLRDFAVESGSLDTVVDTTYGDVLNLDGTTKLLSTGSFDSIADDSDRTFSCWAKTSATGYCPLLCYGELNQPNVFVLYARNTDGYPEVYDYNTRYAPTILESATGAPIPDDTWTFYTFTAGSGVLNIYIDGELWYTTSLVLTTGTTDPFRLATDELVSNFLGVMLDLRVWDSKLDLETIEYMYSVGPNFEESLGTDYAENLLRTRTVAGNILCRSTYGIQPSGNTLTQSFFALDDNSDPQEAARIEHSEDVNGMSNIDIRVRHTDTALDQTLEKTVSITPETTTFNSIENDLTHSVQFSSEGVHLLDTEEEKGCIFFGAGRDFRIRVLNGTFVVQAYSSITSNYVTKMEVGST